MKEEALLTNESISLDEAGFHELFNRFYVPLCVFAYQYVDDNEAAADIVQEVFASLWQQRTEFDGWHQVKAYLYTAVRNRALNEIDHRRVVTEYARNLVERQKEAYFRDVLVEQETYRMLAEAIDRLPERMREIMRLALEGKKNPEIAGELDVSVETVRTLKKLAYKKLREGLKDQYYYILLFLI